MVKHWLFFLLLASLLWGDALDERIKNLVDPGKYQLHQKLIEVIFQDRKAYHREDGTLDIIAVMTELKSNGLLRLFFKEPVRMEMVFKSHARPMLFTKVVSDSLKSLGYYYYITKRSKLDKGRFLWSVQLESEYMIDPVLFHKELQKRGAAIRDIRLIQPEKWEYSIDLQDFSMPRAQSVELLKPLYLKKPVEDYWLQPAQDETYLQIKSKRGNSWYPYVVLLDDDLNVIRVDKRDEKTLQLSVFLPKGCRFVRVSDLYTINNLKNGIETTLLEEK